MTMARKPIQIDRDKLRAEVRKLGSEHVFSILDDAIELLPPAKLLKIAKKYFDLKRLRPDAEQVANPSLLTDVKRFEKASLASEYYESDRGSRPISVAYGVRAKGSVRKKGGSRTGVR